MNTSVAAVSLVRLHHLLIKCVYNPSWFSTFFIILSVVLFQLVTFLPIFLASMHTIWLYFPLSFSLFPFTFNHCAFLLFYRSCLLFRFCNTSVFIFFFLFLLQYNDVSVLLCVDVSKFAIKELASLIVFALESIQAELCWLLQSWLLLLVSILCVSGWVRW